MWINPPIREPMKNVTLIYLEEIVGNPPIDRAILVSNILMKINL